MRSASSCLLSLCSERLSERLSPTLSTSTSSSSTVGAENVSLLFFFPFDSTSRPFSRRFLFETLLGCRVHFYAFSFSSASAFRGLAFTVALYFLTPVLIYYRLPVDCTSIYTYFIILLYLHRPCTSVNVIGKVRSG